jgi:hypothetical protein
VDPERVGYEQKVVDACGVLAGLHAAEGLPVEPREMRESFLREVGVAADRADTVTDRPSAG